MRTPRSPIALLMAAGSILAWPAMAGEEVPCCDDCHCDGGVCENCDCAGEDGACSCEPHADEGCTPGYWKQEHHFDSWPVDLAPEDLFVDVFGVDAFPGLTLVDVLEQGGGGLIALGRHSVAGLLNSVSGEVDYQYSESQILNGLDNAWDSGNYTKIKNAFEDANEAGCPLN